MAAATWSKLPERGSLWGMRSVLFTLNVLGYRVASAMLVPIVGYFFLTGRRSRRASLDYLGRLHRHNPKLPTPTRWLSYQHHLQFAQLLLDRLLLWQGKLGQFQFETHGQELLERKASTGTVLLGAHLGSFDALRVLALRLENRIHVVMFRSHAAHINRLLGELSQDTNVRVLELVPGDINGMLELQACIDRGEHVALLGDRLAPGAKERVCRVPFLGADAAFPQTPWILAALLGCPVRLVTAMQTGPRAYRVMVEPLAERIVLPRKDREAHVRPYVTAFARRLEELCCEHPRQWFNFYDFWNCNE